MGVCLREEILNWRNRAISGIYSRVPCAISPKRGWLLWGYVLVKIKELSAVLYVPVLLSLAVLSHHLIRTSPLRSFGRGRGGGMGMFFDPGRSRTHALYRFGWRPKRVSLWRQGGISGKPLDRLCGRTHRLPICRPLCRHLGEVVWIDARQSKTPYSHHRKALSRFPVAMVQRVASAAGEPPHYSSYSRDWI